MTGSPLQVRLVRTGGLQQGIDHTFRDVVLSPEEIVTWLGVEPPRIPHARRPSRDVAGYRIEFRRGGERRVVEFTHDALDAHLEPLVTRLVKLAEGR